MTSQDYSYPSFTLMSINELGIDRNPMTYDFGHHLQLEDTGSGLVSQKPYLFFQYCISKSKVRVLACHNFQCMKECQVSRIFLFFFPPSGHTFIYTQVKG